MDVDLDIETQALAQVLDGLDYFQLLCVDPTAGTAAVKAAFHAAAKRFHPDRVYQESDGELKARMHRIYKRIVEAYHVLRDETRRAKYAADVAGPHRAERLRYDELAEQEIKRAKDDALGVTPMGKKTFAVALADLLAGRLESAERNLRLALAYEPQNVRFQEKLEEILSARKAARGK